MKDLHWIKDEVFKQPMFAEQEDIDWVIDQVAIRYANEQKRELIEVLKECLDWEYMSLYNEDLYTRIEELITKHKQTERSSE